MNKHKFEGKDGESGGGGEFSVIRLLRTLILTHVFNLGLDARKPVFGGLGTTKHRPACAYAQSDQRLSDSLCLNLLQVKVQFSS